MHSGPETKAKLAERVMDDVMGRLDTADWTEREKRICELAVHYTMQRIHVAPNTWIYLEKGDD